MRHMMSPLRCLLSRKPLAGERICTKGASWRLRQSESELRDEAMRAQMRVQLSLIPLATLVSPLLCQLKFNGGVSSSSSNSNSPSLTGNQALDGGIVGLGLGALGAAVLGPTIQGALNGGQQSQGYSCGRRKRQANFGGSQAS